MTQRLVIPLLVVLAFGAGFGARVWTERDSALPSPPAPGSEFVRGSSPPSGDAKNDAKPAAGSRTDRAKIIADIEKLRPQIDAYRQRLEVIDGDFERDFVALLKPEQLERYTAQKKRNAEGKAKRDARDAAGTGPLTDEQIERMRQRPLFNALWSVSISWRFDHLKNDYKLDDAQQALLGDLLRVRREKFLALIDTVPPPSITLSQLATQAQKLIEPQKAGK